MPCLRINARAWASRRISGAARPASMAATIVLACGMWTLVRTDGMTSSLIGSDFHWRWTPTAEERLLASTGAMPYATAQDAVTAVPTTAPVVDAPPERPAESVDAAAELRREPAVIDPKTARAGPTSGSHGRDFVARHATVSFAACASRPTGPGRLQPRSGVGRSALAGRRLL